MSSHLEDVFAGQLAAERVTALPEYKFCPNRKWSVDFLVFDHLAVEIEGGTWSNGRHSRGSGFEKDAEKYLAAWEHGLTVLRFTGKMVKDGRAIAACIRYQNRNSVLPVKSNCHALPKKERRGAAGTRRASGASGRGKRNGFSRRPRPGPVAPEASPNRRRRGSARKA